MNSGCTSGDADQHGDRAFLGGALCPVQTWSEEKSKTVLSVLFWLPGCDSVGRWCHGTFVQPGACWDRGIYPENDLLRGGAQRSVCPGIFSHRRICIFLRNRIAYAP